ncbi:MAG: DUF2384 domain-containing protein [Proteobacteria bacterium]|nr:DUF2384 domain-containing protein [Pseudomonadota bacterium]
MNLNAQTRLVELQPLLSSKFGNYAECAQWMQTPNPLIDDLPPLSLLKSKNGFDKVKEILKSLS